VISNHCVSNLIAASSIICVQKNSTVFETVSSVIVNVQHLDPMMRYTHWAANAVSVSGQGI
jgi:hypothetical protein